MRIEIRFARMRIPCGRHRFDSIRIECAFDPDKCARVDTPIDFKAMAEAQSTDPPPVDAVPSLTLSQVPVPTCGATLLCDTSTGVPRPLVPPQFRQQVFDTLHTLSHPGVRATQRLITSRYVWPGINKDVREWTRACLQCQRTKVHHHTTTPTGHFPPPDARFSHVHIDLVGPLPPSKGFTYLLTCVDRFTRWPEAIPLPDITAPTVAHAFVTGWIARFGVPSTITTDRGAQFESDLWRQLMHFLGSARSRTTAYHPEANGLVERFHRQLKASLRATAPSTQWIEALPMVLLGLRSSIKEDLGCCTAELVYGTTLRIPGEFFNKVEEIPDPISYVSRLRTIMQQVRYSPPQRHTQRKIHISMDLSKCTHVFVRRDAVRRSLQPPYDGPFKVHQRSPKFFTIIGSTGKHQTVSLDRLKPAYLDITATPPPEVPPTPQPTSSPVVRTTRSGRRVHWPDRLVL